MITRGRLLDRIRVALAGSAAARVVLGEETNFSMPDIRRAQRLASKLVFYYGMSDFGLTTWAFTPYSSDFVVGQNRPRKVVSVDAMDATADWPSKVEELRFDPQDPSDVTWHRLVVGFFGCCFCCCMLCFCCFIGQVAFNTQHKHPPLRTHKKTSQKKQKQNQIKATPTRCARC